ncbi:MAG: hypothetical protein PHH14_03250 [Candidatus Margulisbacteria bacterium]|nr:hypothetical protein [Candidatus Margulisiibacteriota bacterium]
MKKAISLILLTTMISLSFLTGLIKAEENDRINLSGSIEGSTSKEATIEEGQSEKGLFYYGLKYGTMLALLQPVGLSLFDSFKPNILTAVLLIGPIDIIISYVIGEIVGQSVGTALDNRIFGNKGLRINMSYSNSNTETKYKNVGWIRSSHLSSQEVQVGDIVSIEKDGEAMLEKPLPPAAPTCWLIKGQHVEVLEKKQVTGNSWFYRGFDDLWIKVGILKANGEL